MERSIPLAFKWLIIGSLCLMPLEGRAEDKPEGLLTDLIAHTETVYHRGRLTQLSLGDALTRLAHGASADDYQYAAIANSHPAFSWMVPGNGGTQSAYRIIVTDSLVAAEQGRGSIWDSGWVTSSQQTAVTYDGQPLRPNTVYYWRVKTRTMPDSSFKGRRKTKAEEAESAWSDVKAFATGSVLTDDAFSANPIVLNDEYPISSQGHITASGSILYDFGTARFARLSLTAATESTADTLVIHLGERLTDGHVDSHPGGTIRYASVPLPLLKGEHTYDVALTPDSRNTNSMAVKLPAYVGVVMPFRYVEVETNGGHPQVTNLTRAVATATESSDDYAFHCDHQELTDIVSLCDETVTATSFAGVYVDGDRERIPYEADALINQLSHYAMSRDYAMARHTLLFLLDHPTWPTEWIMQGIMIAWNDYLYTGDDRLLRVCYDRLKPRTLLALTEKNGLVSTRTGLQDKAFKESISFAGDKIDDIVDWPRVGFGVNKETGGESDGFVFEDYNAVVNAYHCEVLREMAVIADVLGNEADATEYRRLYDERRKLFNEVFFDAQEGRYADGADTRHASLHANIFPLAFDLVPVEEKPHVLQFVESRGMACSVYGAQFLLDALYNAGNADYALKLMTDTATDRSWMAMLKAGATMTWEAWELKYKSNLDWNHAWGTAPGNVVRRKLMGIEPLTPGWGKARIRPCIGSLNDVEGKVPTIKGDVSFHAQQNDGSIHLHVTLPTNLPATLELPINVSRTISIDGKSVRRQATRDGYALWELTPGSHDIVY